jgi:NAD(P)-dependent dehydrogenase (short-subunit alcohol dehydrogenase family)
MSTPFGPYGLEGRRTVVTGAAMGIGFGIARRFLEAGADVLAVDLDAAALGAAVDRLRGGGARISACTADISSTDAGDVVVAAAHEAFGGIDVLVNNAGIFPQSPLLELEPALLDRVLGVNLRGLVLLSQAVARDMVAAGIRGAVVNIASIDAVHPSMVGLAAYDASKGGVWMFTKSLALELAPHGIRVNAIAPGGVRTEGTGAMPQEVLADFIARKIPLGRMGDPDDIALPALFLASDAAAYMTGSLLVVDGGTLLT